MQSRFSPVIDLRNPLLTVAPSGIAKSHFKDVKICPFRIRSVSCISSRRLRSQCLVNGLTFDEAYITFSADKYAEVKVHLLSPSLEKESRYLWPDDLPYAGSLLVSIAVISHAAPSALMHLHAYIYKATWFSLLHFIDHVHEINLQAITHIY